MPFVKLRFQEEAIRANTVYCIGRNYAEHAKELNNPIPTKPMVFLKPNASLDLIDGKVVLPNESNDVHHEVELVLLIGKSGSHISKENALDFICGIGIGIDFTARDIQTKAKEKGHPWTLSKGFHSFGPVSDFINIKSLDFDKPFELQLTVNDEIRQHGFTSNMIFSLAELVSYISHFSTLHEGDLIFTGTPEGVSQVKSGDILVATLNKDLVELRLAVQ